MCTSSCGRYFGAVLYTSACMNSPESRMKIWIQMSSVIPLRPRIPRVNRPAPTKIHAQDISCEKNSTVGTIQTTYETNINDSSVGPSSSTCAPRLSEDVRKVTGWLRGFATWNNTWKLKERPGGFAEGTPAGEWIRVSVELVWWESPLECHS